MSYTLESLYDVEKKIKTCFDSVLSTAKCKKLEDLGEAALISPQIRKNALASVILSLVNVLDSTHSVLKCASVKLEELQSDQIENQKSVIKLQEELIRSKNEEVSAVQSTVKSEIKSYADIVNQAGNKSAVTTQSIQRAVKSAVGEDQRSKNVVIFGLQEGVNKDLCAIVKDMMSQFTDSRVPAVKDCIRIGAARSGDCRPVKVSFESREAAVSVLSRAKQLRQISQYKSVYISPDRSVEERAARKKLVSQLKEKIEKEPGLYHFIQNGKIQSTEKKTTLLPPVSSSSPHRNSNSTSQRSAAQSSYTAGSTPGMFQRNCAATKQRLLNNRSNTSS